MSVEPQYFETPLHGIYLSVDGYFAALHGSSPYVVIEPSDAQLSAALETVYGRSLRPLGESGEENLGWLWASLGANYETQQVLEMATAAAGAVSGYLAVGGAAITLLQMFGILDKEGPAPALLEALGELNRKLDRVLADLASARQEAYAAWAAGHWRDIDKVIASSTTALQLVAPVMLGHESRTDPFVAGKLVEADKESLSAVNTLIGAGTADGGYWYRPHYPVVLNLDAWEWRTDARPSLTGDFRIWDWRIVLPTLVTSLSARMAVLATLYPEKVEVKGLCPEIKRYATFLGRVIQRMWDNIARKAAPTVWERDNPAAGCLTAALNLGAVDLTTGATDFIMADAAGINLRQAAQRGEGHGPTVHQMTRNRQWGDSFIAREDLAPTITPNIAWDAFGRLDNMTDLCWRQGVFAARRLEAQLPVIQIVQLASFLWDICPARPPAAKRYLSNVSQRLAASYNNLVGTASGRQMARRAIHLISAVEAPGAITDREVFRVAAHLNQNTDDEILSRVRDLAGRFGADTDDM